MARKELVQSNANAKTTGKTLESVASSRSSYAELVQMFGGAHNLPSSILRASKYKHDRDVDLHAAERNYTSTAPYKHLAKGNVAKSLKAMLNVSGVGVKNGALSVFPQNVGKTIVLLYSEPNQIVFDPFAGHNSRMDLCVKSGRHYVGCDLSTEFMRHNIVRSKQLRKLHPHLSITLHHTDSRKVPVKSNSADFTITSPPYWDIEYYGDEPEQMANCKTYDDFLASMKLVLAENFRVLRKGSYAAWFINDFRKKGTMYFYHADILRLGQEVGFTAHDIVVVDLGRGIREAFINQVVKSRILPKRHEYGVIFKKT